MEKNDVVENNDDKSIKTDDKKESGSNEFAERLNGYDERLTKLEDHAKRMGNAFNVSMENTEKQEKKSIIRSIFSRGGR